MELVEKAWAINPININSYHVPEEVVYAETRGQAKQKCLGLIQWDDFKHHDGDDITYLSLKIKRDKYYDKYLVGGDVSPFWQIENDRRTKERNDEVDQIVRENPNAMAYIMKEGLYYRPKSSGYTEHRISAGVYPVQEAADSVKGCSLGDNMKLILINQEEHNAQLNKTISDIQSRLIK